MCLCIVVHHIIHFQYNDIFSNIIIGFCTDEPRPRVHRPLPAERVFRRLRAGPGLHVGAGQDVQGRDLRRHHPALQGHGGEEGEQHGQGD